MDNCIVVATSFTPSRTFSKVVFFSTCNLVTSISAHYDTSIPNSRIRNSFASSLEILCNFPILDRCLLLNLILNPGLCNAIATSSPKIPILGSYFTPGISICSIIPKERLPKLSNDESFIWFPLASKSLFKSETASFPLIVKTTPIGSPLCTPQSRWADFAGV